MSPSVWSMMVAMAQSSKLGSFLRSRRERLSPAEAGFPSAGRRRTPGLRREELALLAGISVDYLVRLEQGRDLSPSAAVLAALSDALRLNEDERQYLMALVAALTQTEMCPTVPPPSRLSSTTLALLERLHPMPGSVVEPWGEVLAWNTAYDRLMRPAGLFEAEPPNLLRYTFLMAASRSLYRDWDAVAREQVRTLRAATGSCLVAGTLERVVGELSVKSADFADLWATHEVGEKRRGTQRMAHPVGGEMELEFEVLILADPGERRLVTYMPADEASAAALEGLVGDDPLFGNQRRLRLVDGGA